MHCRWVPQSIHRIMSQESWECLFAERYLQLLNVWKFLKIFRIFEFSKINFLLNFLTGAERLLRHFHAHKIPMCLATSSSKESVDVKTTHHRELFSVFGHQVMGSSDPDVKEGKPAPDIFLVAAKRFKDRPEPEMVNFWLVYRQNLNFFRFNSAWCLKTRPMVAALQKPLVCRLLWFQTSMLRMNRRKTPLLFTTRWWTLSLRISACRPLRKNNLFLWLITYELFRKFHGNWNKNLK